MELTNIVFFPTAKVRRKIEKQRMAKGACRVAMRLDWHPKASTFMSCTHIAEDPMFYSNEQHIGDS